jgi:hypothetical protein
MTDLLQYEIAGPSVKVRLRGGEYPLAYQMHAVILYKQKTGDSLFLGGSFKKIDLGADPERWLACLWAGLHSQNLKGDWHAPFSLPQLEGMIDFSNAGEISIAMARALVQSMPKPRKDDADPNAAAPGEPEQEARQPGTALSMTLPGSTPVPAAASLDSAAPSS